MQIENKVQEIATTTAMSAAQDFLSTLPPEASQALCPNFLSSLSEDVQADLRAVIHSRLLWSLQALKAELDEQQRQEQCCKVDLVPVVAPAPKPALLAQAELREDASTNIEVSAKPRFSTEPQPLPVPELKPSRKHILVPKSAPRKQAESPSIPPSLSGLNNDLPSQLELRVMAEVEPSKSAQRPSGKEPQSTREEILKPYSFSPNDVVPRPVEAGRRRRRTSIALS